MGRFVEHVASLVGASESDDLVDLAVRRLLGAAIEPWEAGGPSSPEVDDALRRSLARNRVQIRRLDAGRLRARGRLVPSGDSLDLLIRADMRRTTYRYVLAHELVHALAFESRAGRMRRVVPWSSEEERFCERAACRILAPPSALCGLGLFEGDVLATQRALERRATTLCVSLWLLISRLLENRAEEQHLGVLWSYSVDEDGSQVVRVVESRGPRGLFVPKSDRSFEGETRNQLPWRCLRSGLPVEMVDIASIGSIRGELPGRGYFAGRDKEWIACVYNLSEELKKKAVRWRLRRQELKAPMDLATHRNTSSGC